MDLAEEIALMRRQMANDRRKPCPWIIPLIIFLIIVFMLSNHPMPQMPPEWQFDACSELHDLTKKCFIELKDSVNDVVSNKLATYYGQQ